MKYSIIIPTYNHLNDLLRPCVQSILNHTTLGKDFSELIIVSNGSTDGTQKYIKSLNNSNIVLLDYPDPIGYSKANNEGFKISNGEIIVLLNNDTLLLPQEKDSWLNMLGNPFINSSVGITGPLENIEANRRFLIFFCVAIRRSLFTTLGGLDESFGIGGFEDADMCFKIEDLGFKIVRVPENRVVAYSHNHNTNQGGFPIYHKGEGTVNHIPNWVEIFNANKKKLHDKYWKWDK